MKIEVDVEMPEGYEPTGGSALSYFPPGSTVLTVYVVLRQKKRKRQVIVFIPVDEFEGAGVPDWPGRGWASSLKSPSGIDLYPNGFAGFPVQWYRREVREE